jgi:long-subunit fatty acid transport protein
MVKNSNYHKAENMKILIKKTHYLLLFLLILASSAKAQDTETDDVENDYESRTSMTLTTKVAKNLKLSLSPELRFDNSFSLDKYLLEGKASYKCFDNLSLGLGYRFYANKRETKSTEYDNRFLLSMKYTKSINRFDPSFKISYTNDSDDDSDTNLLRYKGELQYNIRKCKLTPWIGAEAFQSIDDGDLSKMRYFLGMDYKISKKNSIEASYKFDYFINELKNKHIVSIGYNIKL